MLIFLSLLLTVLASPPSAADAPIVDLGYAAYQGVGLPAGVTQFLGLRYAAPPLGERRFRAPADPPRSSTIQDASRFRPICVGVSQTVSDSQAEDCLFINVFTPSNATSKSRLPVWLYIQGGGYAADANANFNGTAVIQQAGFEMVFVNFNYRTGALGFLASEQVRQHGDLNVGLLDQRKALRWVQQYIKMFGGDPSHVVIHGASAGAGSVAHHLVAYGGRDDGLFVGAVAQSPFWPTQRTVAEMQFQYDRFVNDTGCAIGEKVKEDDDKKTLECLRGLDIATIQAANVPSPFPGARSTTSSPLPTWYFLPVIDGDLIPDDLYRLFDTGRFLSVPLMVGSDTDEGSTFASDASTPDEVSSFLQTNYPHLTDPQLKEINTAYPLLLPALPAHRAYFPSLSAAYGDATFTCPALEIATALAARQTSPVWTYRYNVLSPLNQAAGLGVPHMFETAAIFGPGFAGPADPSYSTLNSAIVPVTMAYWVSFILTLDPNPLRSAGAPVWPRSERNLTSRLRLQTNASVMEAVPNQLTEKCTMWRRMAGVMEV
ncbi:hypothetical protein ASPZODRAFT_55150 [Penicilliopsis zonata CBS 506.65]|uniref:Carboxylic ester hydrolase n=1 Tax=Penicilliopsis zonata CBS 506.65 TaxID=1073090 RepID=A0A1L9SU69_9EURO|nr:hypothetical protein ASPZODRAFT_55150 [Penicilliopsis zonata CBS 506.65]OJJ50739.1 hypothetical protein ASPZODRAFT_55150 [Penicilliopsis zonata CBS 506.65]